MIVWTFSVATIVLGTGLVFSQNYPTRPIHLVTPEVGGGADLVARLIAQGIGGPLGQPVVVDNRPSGVIPGDTVAKAPPDGYTLLVTGSNHWLTPLMQANVPYDAVKDFAPITLVIRGPNVLVVHRSLPVKSVKELIALAKARPGVLNYGSSAVGTPSHLGAEMLKSMAGIDILRVSYRGTGPLINALITGEVQLMVSSAPAVMPHVKSGRLRALAVTSAEPSALAPGLPSVAATVPGYDAVSIIALFAPAKTPEPIINRLNQEVVRVIDRADVKERLFNAGGEVVGGSPTQLGSALKFDLLMWGKVMLPAVS